MTQIFDGKFSTYYGQIHIVSDRHDDCGITECTARQVNGLCGTALPGTILIMTGLHSGSVGLTIEVLDSPPPIAEEWEEVVEAPFSVSAEEGKNMWLESWMGDRVCNIPLSPGSYRVRYCARNMDEGRDIDTIVDEELIDFYALYVWPDDLIPEEIIKQTSRYASCWHKTVQGYSHFDAIS